jgi:hypothetical protein
VTTTKRDKRAKTKPKKKKNRQKTEKQKANKTKVLGRLALNGLPKKRSTGSALRHL